MTHRSYYRQQAKLLLSWALAASDPDHAARLEAQACQLLMLAELPEDSDVDFDHLVDEFNDEQMRKS
jgi:hypothetical protein